MSKGTTDSVRYYYAMARKGLEYIHEMGKVSSDSKESLDMMKDCAQEIGIGVEEFIDGTYLYRTAGGTQIVGPFPESGPTIWLCSNKFATFEFLRRHDFEHLPHYRRYSLGTINEAREDFLARGKAVVVKPSRQTYGGTGVTANIQTMRQLNKAIFRSLVYDSYFQMEDFIEGDNFRILLYRDKVLSIIHRLPANVVGDGESTIGQLISNENERRSKAKDRDLRPIAIDSEVRLTLKNKGMSLKHVPSKDERVYVRTVCNHHAGGEVKVITGSAHPEVVRDCQDIMRMMGIIIGGIDIITRDISRPLGEVGGVINEVNTSPGMSDHGRAAVMYVIKHQFGGGPSPAEASGEVQSLPQVPSQSADGMGVSVLASPVGGSAAGQTSYR